MTRSQCYYTWLLTSVTASLQTHVHVRCKRWPAFFCFALLSLFCWKAALLLPTNTQSRSQLLSRRWPLWEGWHVCDPISPSMWWCNICCLICYSNSNPTRQESGEILSQEMFSEIFTVTSHRGHWSGHLLTKSLINIQFD